VLSLHGLSLWLSFQQRLIYTILLVQLLCSNVRFLPRKYYGVQIFSFIGYGHIKAALQDFPGKEKQKERKNDDNGLIVLDTI
jgi:hypothetical protein